AVYRDAVVDSTGPTIELRKSLCRYRRRDGFQRAAGTRMDTGCVQRLRSDRNGSRSYIADVPGFAETDATQVLESVPNSLCGRRQPRINSLRQPLQLLRWATSQWRRKRRTLSRWF